jgi:uncharacterized membrane protein YgcG
VRLCCENPRGRGEWSGTVLGTTTPQVIVPRVLDTRIPPSWLALRANIGDLLSGLQRRHGVEPDAAWGDLVGSWRRHVGDLKLAYRLYVLLESPDADPRDMNLTQFRKFVDDIQLPEAGRADTDLVFTRVNRVAELLPSAVGSGNGMSRAVANQAAKLATKLGAKSAAVRTDKMDQAEFVHAILRLGVLRAERRAEKRKGGAGPRVLSSLGASFDEIMEACVAPNAVPTLEDGFAAQMVTRGVRAALSKHHDALYLQFERWSASDRGVGARDNAMSLAELMQMLKAARLLDHRCTAKTVTAMFCRINAADEVFLPVEAERAGGGGGGGGGGLGGGAGGAGGGGSGGGSASELDYFEFAELMCRICDARVPPSTRSGRLSRRWTPGSASRCCPRCAMQRLE